MSCESLFSISEVEAVNESDEITPWKRVVHPREADLVCWRGNLLNGTLVPGKLNSLQLNEQLDQTQSLRVTHSYSKAYRPQMDVL